MTMILRITRVFFFAFLLVSVPVQSRILQERSRNSMVESDSEGLSTPETSSFSTLRNSPGDVVLMIIKKPLILQTAVSRTFPARVTESFSYRRSKGIPSPPAPKLAPPHHNLQENEATSFPYESPPIPSSLQAKLLL